MQEVILKGKIITSPMVRWITEYKNTEITRFIIEKEQTGKCSAMIVCFGKWASAIGKMVTSGDVVNVSGRLRGFVFHDADGTPHYVNYVAADKITTDDGNVNLSNELDVNEILKMEETCLEIMNENDYLPVSENDYEQLIESAGDNVW